MHQTVQRKCLHRWGRLHTAHERQRPPRTSKSTSRLAARLPGGDIKKHEVTMQCGNARRSPMIFTQPHWQRRRTCSRTAVWPQQHLVRERLRPACAHCRTACLAVVHRTAHRAVLRHRRRANYVGESVVPSYRQARPRGGTVARVQCATVPANVAARTGCIVPGIGNATHLPRDRDSRRS